MRAKEYNSLSILSQLLRPRLAASGDPRLAGFQFFPSCCQVIQLRAPARTTRSALSILSQLLPEERLPRVLERVPLLSILSQLLHSQRDLHVLRDAALSILSQLLRRRYMFAFDLAGAERLLSILSQLLPADPAEGEAGAAHRHFQFFPSCCHVPRKRCARRRKRLSILSQLLPA